MSIYGPDTGGCSDSTASNKLALSAYARRADLRLHQQHIIQIRNLVHHIRKPMITIWTEEVGKLVAGNAEWSFGGGAQGSAHRKCGYPIPTNGTIVKMALVSVNMQGESPYEAIISLVVNGTVTHHLVRKLAGEKTMVHTLEPGLRVQAGSVVNFISRINIEARSSVVSLLIELDL